MEMQKENKNETNEGKENDVVRDAEVAEAKCAGVGMEGSQKKQSRKSDKKATNKSVENIQRNLRRKQTRSPNATRKNARKEGERAAGCAHGSPKSQD